MIMKNNSNQMRIAPLILIALAFFWSDLCFAQEPVRIKRLAETVTFDGMPSENAWNTLDQFTMTMHKPNFNALPSEKSEVMIGYDDEFLWVGARLYVKDVSKIFATTRKRDEELFDYDAFGILLDTYDDNENALCFYTTPTGLRTDYTISGDASQMGGGPGMIPSMNFSWNTFWDVKTTLDDKGWYVEMRIPFSSLKFKPQNDVTIMGLIITRNISSNSEVDTWPAIDPKYGFLATSKPSLANTIEISGARPRKPLYVSPYIIAGNSREWSLNEEGTAWTRDDKPEFNAGLDIKYNINSNLTLDLTANTDFAQVEADDQQVNLTRYSLFFPEKRIFFQERASLFDFGLGGPDNLFYSRNIGIEGRELIRIYGGARLTGRIGKTDVGLMSMQTEEHEALPGENFSVIRLRRQVINENSYVGGIVTTRLGMNGSQNVAYGIDGIFRLFGDDYLNAKWSQVYDPNNTRQLNSLDPSFMMLNWERRSEDGFGYNLSYNYTGEQFNPGIGFVMRGGVQGFNGEILYGWIPGEKSKFFNYSVFVRGERFTRLSDGGLESMGLQPGFEINTKRNLHGEVALEYQEEGVMEDFKISDSILIKAGNYSFTGFELSFGTSQAKMVSLRADLSGGKFYDGNRYTSESETNFNLSSSFKLTAAYEFNALRFPDREISASLNIHSLNMKLLYMFSTKLSATLMTQYVNTEDELITNFRLRYNPREGNDLYIVFNDFRGIADDHMIPQRPGYYNKTIMIKYTHTFKL
jgi:hypothetical protein